jgi:carboxypeptidase Taq
MTAQAAYDELIKRMKEAAILESAQAVLGWDERTYMPRAGAGLRAEQISMLSGMVHEQTTDPRIDELLSVIEGSDLVADPESVAAVNVREIRRKYDKERKLPKDLVQEISRVSTLAQGEWAKARQESNYAHFQPWLDKVLSLTRRQAEAYGYEGEPYNALMDDYEPGATVDEIAGVFEALRLDLVELLGRITEAPKKPDESIVRRVYPVDKQRLLGEMVGTAMGYDFSAGRLDVTTHPFCTGIGTGDTRITTRYNPHRLNDALFGTMHEAGHALYEMGIDKAEHFGTPMGASVSLGIHESQSRMWENQVGRSKAFWSYFFPQLKGMFREALEDVSLDDFYGAINFVTPSYIRVEADEATYNLHILLRFELERAMLSGDLPTADVPGEWNSRFKKYFGIEVDKDANGCLQDIHWASGAVGYFPTYTLGNLYSAQFFAAARSDIPGLTEQFERGQFDVLLSWLRKNIHHHGRRYRAADLAVKVTGKPLSHKPLIDYMKAKYGEIYGF